MSQGVVRVVADRYHLIRPLGRGGMGVVWQAHDGLLDRGVAVKEIYLPTATAGPDNPANSFALRGVREAQAAAQLRHPGIITVHDVVIDDGRPWIVMELVDGRSLAQAVAADGALPEQRAALIGLQVLDALWAAHRHGILHRDVKPANILLDGDRVVLTDFGIAAIDGATALTATGQMVGSPAYLAPERINGRPATTATDLWALGVTLYATVAGRTPFQRDDTQGTYAAVLTSQPPRPDGVGRLWPAIQGLLAKDPARRLTAELTAPLLAAVAHPPATPQPTAPPRQRRWWPSRRTATPPQPILAAQPILASQPAPASQPAAAPQPAPASPAGLPRALSEPADVRAPSAADTPPATPAEPDTGDPPTSTDEPSAAGPDTAPHTQATPDPIPTTPTLPTGGPLSARETRAARPTAKAIRWISAAAAVLLVTAFFVWMPLGGPPDPNPGVTPTHAEHSPSAVRSATPSAAPSWTPPAPPPGFKAATAYAVYFAVPKGWPAYGGDSWTNNDDGPDALEQMNVLQDVKGTGTTAVAYVISEEKVFQDYEQYRKRRVRLTTVPAPAGAKSAADWEYTTTATNLRFGYEHAIARVIAWPDGTINVVTVSVGAGSTAQLKRAWTKARPTAVKILNSVALHR